MKTLNETEISTFVTQSLIVDRVPFTDGNYVAGYILALIAREFPEGLKIVVREGAANET